MSKIFDEAWEQVHNVYNGKTFDINPVCKVIEIARKQEEILGLKNKQIKLIYEMTEISIQTVWDLMNIKLKELCDEIRKKESEFNFMVSH